MSVRFLGAVALGICLAAGVRAQSLAEVSTPANPPPASFKGQQFIDSRGCVFVRAGFGGRVNWVARIDARKRPICGMLPTGAAEPPIEDVAPERTAEAAPSRPGLGVRAGLFAAPAPVAAPPQDVAITFTEPVRETLPPPPRGWAYAWKDDRLNPMRGKGTAQGEAEQDRVWTRTVPMQRIADLPAEKRPKAQQRARSVTVSTMSAPAQAIYVQVGSFGQPANATRSRDRIAALGLPVRSTRAKALETVMAGPFASTEAASGALAALRAAGFADAFLR